MKKTIFLIIIILLTTTLTGCSLSLTSSSKSAAGVFKSYDFGEKWQSTNIIKGQDKKKESLDKVNVNQIKLDPQDRKNVYLASSASGLWYSEDAAANWQNIFTSGNVYDFVLDPQKSGVVYASLGQKVYKTLDLGQNWQSIYLETRPEVIITALAIDPVDNLLVYLGTSNGEVYKTQDGGESWQLSSQIKKAMIKKILVNPKNSRIIYLATQKLGIYRSSDQGKNWQNLKDNYYDAQEKGNKTKYKGVEFFQDLVFDLTQSDSLLYASNYGLLKTNNGGRTWQDIKLLTPANSIIIKSVAVNPQDKKQIYYSTDTALYRTFDAGQTWLASSLPSTYSANYLLVDPQTPNVVYMGMAKATR